MPGSDTPTVADPSAGPATSHMGWWGPLTVMLSMLAVVGCALPGAIDEIGASDTTPVTADAGALLSAVAKVTTTAGPTTSAPPASTVPAWSPPVLPTTFEAMEQYLRQELGCDEVVPMESVPHGFVCQFATVVTVTDLDAIYVVPLSDEPTLAQGRVVDDDRNTYRAAYDAFRFALVLEEEGLVDGGPIGESGGCWILASAGPWSLGYVEYNLLPGQRSDIAEVIDTFDAVVHEDCGMPDLAPDTLTLVKALGGWPTCEPSQVNSEASRDGVFDWSDYDAAFRCTNGWSMVRIPPGTAETFRNWTTSQVGCRPFVLVDRWLIHQSATTAIPADYDQSLLQGLATTYGTRVVNPCRPS